MRKKNNFSPFRVLLLLTIVVSLASCEKEEPPKFSGDNFLYFMNNEGVNLNTGFTMPSLENNFNFFSYQLDEIDFNIDPRFPLSIQTDGKLMNTNRVISIEIDGNGKEYVELPPSDYIIIPANGTEVKLNLKLIRPLIADTGLKTVTLTLKNNEYFSPEKHEWSKITYKFGNQFVAPINYDLVKDIYGGFSPAKMYAIQAAVNGAGSEVWGAEPKLTTLNTYLKGRKIKEINFAPFGFDDLYNFISLGTEISTYPVLIKDAYSVIAKKMITLTNSYIVEQRIAGKPILDEAGNEISFPQ